jgi:protein-disulfide isomerase
MIYPTLKRVAEESGGKVAWVFRTLPLESIHPQARPAAEAAECIAALKGNDAYWQFMDDAFANQTQLGSSWYSAEAVKLGVEANAFNTCVTNKTYDSRIDTDLAEAIQLGANGTPFTVVMPKGGKSITFSGALPYAQVRAIVNSVVNKQPQ